jgi:hypothetical protein
MASSESARMASLISFTEVSRCRRCGTGAVFSGVPRDVTGG